MSQIDWLLLPAVLVKNVILLATMSTVAHAVRQSILTLTKQWETDAQRRYLRWLVFSNGQWPRNIAVKWAHNTSC